MKSRSSFLLLIIITLTLLTNLSFSQVVTTTHFSYVTVSKYEVLVSPYNMTDIVNLLEEANKSIYVEVYLLTYQSLANVLASKAKSGVQVYLVLSSNVYGGIPSEENSLVQYLESSGVHVKFVSHFYYVHSKVYVIDNNTVIISTNNPSYYGFTQDLGVAIVIYNSTIATWFSTIILNDYNCYFPNYNYTGLVISPINSYSQLNGLFSYNSPTIYASIEEIYSDSDLTTPLFSHQNKYIVASRTDQNIPTNPDLTSKVVVVGDYVYIGSINLSHTSVYSNRELGIIIMNSTLAEQMKSLIMHWYNEANSSNSGGITFPSNDIVYMALLVIIVLVTLLFYIKSRR